MITTTSKFLAHLERSRLLNESVMSEIRARDADENDFAIARSLVDRKLLTIYQANHLLRGKSSGFQVGHYKILQPLRSGGMGVVYLAEHVWLKRVVVLKVIRRKYLKSRSRVARFAHEAAVASQLNHPNIVHVFDYDVENEIPYMVMEYVEGIDARRLVSRSGPLTWRHAADYVRQAAAGLQFIHDAGFVHRDVSPDNLIVDRQGHVKVLDFGLAISQSDAPDPSAKPHKEQVGTWDFVAPEQAEIGSRADTRSDIYGLGATFYYLLAGRVMFPGCASIGEKIDAQKHLLPKPLTAFIADLPPAIVKIVDRMLAKNPDDRFQTAAQVVAALSAFAATHDPAFDPSFDIVSRGQLTPLLGLSATDSGHEAASSDVMISQSEVLAKSHDGSGSTIADRACLDDTLKTTKPVPKPNRRRRLSVPTLAAAIGFSASLAILIMSVLSSAKSESNPVARQPASNAATNDRQDPAVALLPFDQIQSLSGEMLIDVRQLANVSGRIRPVEFSIDKKSLADNEPVFVGAPAPLPLNLNAKSVIHWHRVAASNQRAAQPIQAPSMLRNELALAPRMTPVDHPLLTAHLADIPNVLEARSAPALSAPTASSSNGPIVNSIGMKFESAKQGQGVSVATQPVTAAQFRQFVNETDYVTSAESDKRGGYVSRDLRFRSGRVVAISRSKLLLGRNDLYVRTCERFAISDGTILTLDGKPITATALSGSRSALYAQVAQQASDESQATFAIDFSHSEAGLGAADAVRLPAATWRTPHGEKKPPIDGDWVSQITSSDASKFCEWLSEKEGRHYRLPIALELREHPSSAHDIGVWCAAEDASASGNVAGVFRPNLLNSRPDNQGRSQPVGVVAVDYRSDALGFVVVCETSARRP